MTLVVETGSNVSGSNGYASTTFVAAYFEARFNTDWLAIADQEAAIILASSWLDNQYRGKWKGRRTWNAQNMAWPRYGVYDEDNQLIDDDTIPEVLKQATAEMALRLGRGDNLSPDLERGGDISRQRVKAGPVETETEYAAGASSETRVTVVEKLLSGLITGSGIVQRIDRA